MFDYLGKVAVVEHPDVGTGLLDEHQSGFDRGEDVASLELVVLGGTFCTGSGSGGFSGCGEQMGGRFRRCGFRSLGRYRFGEVGFQCSLVETFPIVGHGRFVEVGYIGGCRPAAGTAVSCSRNIRSFFTRFKRVVAGIVGHAWRFGIAGRVEDRDVRHVFRVEVDGRDGIELAQ